MTFATATAVPLLCEFVVTVAVRSPAVVGLAVRFTTIVVAVADDTVPTAPPTNTTVLLLAVVPSKPNPRIVTLVASAARRLDEPFETTGITVATWTSAPLLRVSVATEAVSEPAEVGLVVKRTVSEVGVAEITLPAAPLLKVTTLSPAIVSKPKPWIVIVLALAFKLVVLLVTTGMTVATWTAAPLEMVLVLTTAVSEPADVGLVDNVTVIEVAVAVVTAPTAPLLKVTRLLPGVASNPKPAMTTVAASAARFATALVTTGRTEAT